MSESGKGAQARVSAWELARMGGRQEGSGEGPAGAPAGQHAAPSAGSKRGLSGRHSTLRPSEG